MKGKYVLPKNKRDKARQLSAIAAGNSDVNSLFVREPIYTVCRQDSRNDKNYCFIPYGLITRQQISDRASKAKHETFILVDRGNRAGNNK